MDSKQLLLDMSLMFYVIPWISDSNALHHHSTVDTNIFAGEFPAIFISLGLSGGVISDLILNVVDCVTVHSRIRMTFLGHWDPSSPLARHLDPLS